MGGRESAPGLPARIQCASCGARYPIRYGIPILLPDEGSGGTERDVGAYREAAESRIHAPPRVRRAASVLRSQGLGPFATKAWRGLQTELERRVPVLRRGPEFICNCCDSRVRFLSYRGRPLAQCPVCGAKERDRLLLLALSEVVAERGEPDRVLHASPESMARRFLAGHCHSCIATDLTHGLTSHGGRLDAAADLTSLPFDDGVFDLVVASHVLEHIPDDRAAIREVHRVLAPGGVAVLPVPILHAGPTVEYGTRRADEEMHVRAPGMDYFERFEAAGFGVRALSSADYGVTHQVRSYHRTRDRAATGADELSDLTGPSKYAQWVPICSKPT